MHYNLSKSLALTQSLFRQQLRGEALQERRAVQETRGADDVLGTSWNRKHQHILIIIITTGIY